MFLPGVSLKIKLVGILVLAILTFSLIGAALEMVNQAVTEGAGQAQFSGEQVVTVPGVQSQASDGQPIVTGLKFVCPFH